LQPSFILQHLVKLLNYLPAEQNKTMALPDMLIHDSYKLAASLFPPPAAPLPAVASPIVQAGPMQQNSPVYTTLQPSQQAKKRKLSDGGNVQVKQEPVGQSQKLSLPFFDLLFFGLFYFLKLTKFLLDFCCQLLPLRRV
jgi:hypothetical protein